MGPDRSELQRLLLLLTPYNASEALLLRILANGGELSTRDGDFVEWREQYCAGADDERSVAATLARANSSLIALSNGQYGLVQLPSEPPKLVIQMRAESPKLTDTGRECVLAALDRLKACVLHEIDVFEVALAVS